MRKPLLLDYSKRSFIQVVCLLVCELPGKALPLSPEGTDTDKLTFFPSLVSDHQQFFNPSSLY